MGAAAFFKILGQILQLLLALVELRDLDFELWRTEPLRADLVCFLLGITLVQLLEVRAHLVLNLRQQGFEFWLAVITSLGVLRFDLGRIYRHQFAAEELQLAAKQDKFTADRLDRLAVVAAEVSHRFEVRPQFAQQPDEFQIARRFPLQSPTGTHPVEITVEIEPEEIPWIIRWSSCLIELRLAKTGLAQIELPDKGFDEAHRIFRRDVIIQDLGQEQRLASITPSDVVHPGIGACQTNSSFATTTSSES